MDNSKEMISKDFSQNKLRVLLVIIAVLFAAIIILSITAMYFYIEAPISGIAAAMDMFFMNWLGYLPFL